MPSAETIRLREQAFRDHTAGGGPGINVGEAERVASKVGGGLLIAAGLYRGGLGGLAIAGLGGLLAYRGYTGQCSLYRAMGIDTLQEDETPYGVEARAGVKVEEAMTIDRPAEELYAYWRDHANLPKFMPNIESVESPDGVNSHWVMSTPLGMNLEWDSTIHTDDPGRMFSWASTGGQLSTAGSVHFVPAPGGRGTEVRLVQKYDPPLGKLGVGLASLMGMSPSGMSRATLRHLKQLMEAGEIPTTEGQPQGPSRWL